MCKQPFWVLETLWSPRAVAEKLRWPNSGKRRVKLRRKSARKPENRGIRLVGPMERGLSHDYADRYICASTRSSGTPRR